ncbi:MAG: chorismate--pyruvate lyase family protein [Pseudomonadales bacterium]
MQAALSQINFDTRWTTFRRPNNLQAPRPWRSWLCDRGSLTEHLIAASDGDFDVQVQRQQWLVPSRSEAKILGLKNRQLALVREVKLCGGGTPWVFARTVIPVTTLTGRQKQFSQLGNRSLGTVLFNDPSMRRGAFQISRLTASTGERLWARRSLFYLDNKPLLVCEVFLAPVAALGYQPPLLPSGKV